MIRHWGDREDYQDWVDRARHNPRKGEESGYFVGALLVIALLIGLMYLGAWLTSLV